MTWGSYHWNKWSKYYHRRDDDDDGCGKGYKSKYWSWKNKRKDDDDDRRDDDRPDGCDPCAKSQWKYEKYIQKAEHYREKADSFLEKGCTWLAKKYNCKADKYEKKAEKYKCEEPNTAPEITSPNDGMIVQIAPVVVGDILNIETIDADGDNLIFTLTGEEVGGVSDADFFEIVKVDDTLAMLNTKGVPLPITGSVDGDLAFELTLTVDDQNGGVDTIDIIVELAAGG